MQTATALSTPAHASFEKNGLHVTVSAESVDALIADLAKFGIVFQSLAADTSPVKSTGKPKAEKAAAAAASAEPAPSPAPSPAADAKPSAAAETPKTKAVDYPTLQAAVFKLAAAVTKKGLDKQAYVVKLANDLGAPTFKELPADQWPVALAMVNAQLAKVEAVEVEVA